MASDRGEGLRLSRPVRDQIAWDRICLDELIAADHRAREVWEYVDGLDLSALLGPIRSLQGGPGRAAIDPRVLMSLWLYATLEGVGSARRLERLCQSEAAYRWICGGVGVNHHTLADFRIAGGKVLGELLVRSMAALAQAGIVDHSCLAVDGVRVRASAGASSFRRQTKLTDLLWQAEQKLAALQAELDADPAAESRRARERALRETQARKARLEAARRAAEAIEAERHEEAKRQRRKTPKKAKPPVASTTDPQARMMVMADGGYRPAYNLQFRTDPRSLLVVSFEATNKASDAGQLITAIDDIAARYGVKPGRVFADGGYAKLDDIEAAHQHGIEVFSPPSGSGGKAAPAKPQPGDGPGVTLWRERMSSKDGWQTYRRRFACEKPHADARNRGLQRVPVRGLDKVQAVGLWFVTAYNFLQSRQCSPQPA